VSSYLGEARLLTLVCVGVWVCFAACGCWFAAGGVFPLRGLGDHPAVRRARAVAGKLSLG
jgi:hypothetical protein